MNPGRVRRSLTILTGAPLALLVLGWLAPGPARATCGDYVVMGKSGSHPATQARTAAHKSGAEKPMPVPCPGPLCSRRVPLPITPPAPPASPQDHFAGLVPLSTPPLADHSTIHREIDSPRAICRTADIFHPPRS